VDFEQPPTRDGLAIGDAGIERGGGKRAGERCCWRRAPGRAAVMRPR
jgi:hypothetical protein